MHLADAFIQSDLHCIQVTVSTFFLSALAFPGNRTHDFGVANAMLYQLSYRKAGNVSKGKESMWRVAKYSVPSSELELFIQVNTHGSE